MMTPIHKQCLFIAALITGYIINTAWAKHDVLQDRHPIQHYPDSTINDSFQWKKANINHTLPVSFQGQCPNVLSRPQALFSIFDTLCHKERPLRILQLGDSHVAAGSYPTAVRTTLEKAWGYTCDSTTYRVHYRYIARNGATLNSFSTEKYIQQIIEENPDLLILSFGTNECHGMGYREEQHREQLENFHAILSECNPRITILLTTPPGDYLTVRSIRYLRYRKGQKRRKVIRRTTKINPMSTRCATVIEQFGQSHNFAVWNLNQIAGSTMAARNWMTARLMASDRIHFTPEGYQLHGQLLGEAILKAYNQYLESQ